MMVRKAKKGGPVASRAESVDMGQVRFTAADIRLLLGFLTVFTAAMGLWINTVVDRATTRLQLSMSTTYTTKDEFRAHADETNRRLADIHNDVAKIAEKKR